MGPSGQLVASSTSNGGAYVTALQSNAQATSATAAVAHSATDSTTAFAFQGASFAAYDLATISPNSTYVSNALATHSNVGASALSGSQAAVFAAGVLGASYAPGATGSQEYIDTQTFTLNGAAMSGHLILGLLDTQTVGTGFSNLKFTVMVGGATVVNQTFTTAAAANAFFANDAVDLGAFASVAGLQVVVKFDLTTATAGSGYGEDFILGVTNGNAALRDNFNWDGASDILWRDANGSVNLYESNGGGFGFTSLGLGTVDNGWVIQQTGDFNGDGKADILWRNVNGDVYIDLSNPGGAFTGFTGHDVGVIPTSWTIEQIGDFNGDGKADILWRNANGDVELYLSNAGAGFTGFNHLDIGVIPTSWSIQQVGDFNGDGKADILWRNSNGDVDIYFSNPGAGFTGFTSVDIGALGSSWTLQQVGDFNGVGKDGMLWRNSNGDVELYLANPGAGFTGFTVVDVGVVSSALSVAAVGDYNGDGKADILWRNSNGDVAFWLSNSGAGFTGFTSHDNGVVPTDWSIVGDSPPTLGSVPGHQTVTSSRAGFHARRAGIPVVTAAVARQFRRSRGQLPCWRRGG